MQQQKEQRVSLISKKEVELIRVEWKFVLNTILSTLYNDVFIVILFCLPQYVEY